MHGPVLSFRPVKDLFVNGIMNTPARIMAEKSPVRIKMYMPDRI